MDACDVVTVARGDLGSNLGLLHLPAAQKDIAARCRRAGKPFLVVTQLLHTMTEHPTPTRAEVLDVYNAVLDGALALMLTGETARGRYPGAGGPLAAGHRPPGGVTRRLSSNFTKTSFQDCPPVV